MHLEVPGANSEIGTLSQLLRVRAERAPGRTAFVFLENGERESGRLTYGGLEQRAHAIAARLQSAAAPGDRAILLYPPGLEFICSLAGCLLAGVIAVPAYPPRRNRSLHRLRTIAADCAPAVVLTDAATLNGLAQHSAEDSWTLRIPFVATDREAATAAGNWTAPRIEPDTLAILQYTSGSTGTPKGVMVSHRNALSNAAVMVTAFPPEDEAAVFVSWLPHVHDMGLFGNVVLPLYLGLLAVHIEPAAFVQKPVRWLQAVSNYRASFSGGPDSAFDLCARKIPDSAKAALDLSSWRTAYNGAETVRRGTIERFTRAFAQCGFRAESMRPLYGLAEATLFVTGDGSDSPAVIRELDAERLSEGMIEPARANAGRKMQSSVSCGRTWLDHELRIVDPATGVPCAPGRVGEIWVSGPSIAQGYWNRPEESERTFRARLPGGDASWLRTGDLGFKEADLLFVTGRLKDLIIVAGRNLYPQDLEKTAEESDAVLVPNASAAFSVDLEEDERVVVACEVQRGALRGLNVEAVTASVRRALADEHEVELYAVLLLRTRTIPRTSSGKIQRSVIRAAFLSGEGLEIVGEWRRPARAESGGPETLDIVKWLTEKVARRAGIPASQVDPHEAFSWYGLGSVDAIALSGELQEWLGREVPPTLFYDFPSIDRVARHLAREDSEPASKAAAKERGGGTIAITGIGCRFPGARNPREFWRLLEEGRDAVAAAKGRAVGSARAGLLEQVDEFDAEFFGINGREAEVIDPQQRLLLELAWETLENACVAPRSLAGTRTAVIVGISTTDYAGLAGAGPYAATGNALSMAANRISYTLDLRGPSWAVDTACSSSLVAVHQACRALRQGECDAALTGGVNLILSPGLSNAFLQAGMLSPDGECRTFDAAANGYVRGEGAGMVLLKRLEDAIRDNDAIMAVIRGSAVNQDGRSNGLTAPNGPAQRAAIREALADAGVAPRQVGYVEAHGTGTPLGDPIEMNSLVAVLNEGRAAKDVCRVGSVKTNIGHLEAAAGIAGLIKTALVLQHREIPAHLHYRSLNPHIALQNTPFRIAEQTAPWMAADGTRFAGVSSFGFGGTNAHAILGEAPVREAAVPAGEQPPVIVAFSARTPAALRVLAKSYAEYIEGHPDVVLRDLAFSLNTGRSHFAHRAVAEAGDAEGLRLQLLAIADGGSAVPRHPLAVRYMNGDTVDWAELYAGGGCRKLALPTYPFERRRRWMEDGAHPLLGRRLEQQAHQPSTWTWESSLDGPAAAFLSGHRMLGSAVLPWSAYAEMALSAAAQAGGEDVSAVTGLTLHHPLFLREGEPRTIQTVLSRQSAGRFSFAVYHRPGAPDSMPAKWQLCASATIEQRGAA